MIDCGQTLSIGWGVPPEIAAIWVSAARRATANDGGNRRRPRVRWESLDSSFSLSEKNETALRHRLAAHLQAVTPSALIVSIDPSKLALFLRMVAHLRPLCEASTRSEPRDSGDRIRRTLWVAWFADGHVQASRWLLEAGFDFVARHPSQLRRLADRLPAIAWLPLPSSLVWPAS